MANFKVEETTFEKLFATPSVAFQVPAFQRPYAWRAEEISQLLSDLFEDSSRWMMGPSPEHSYFIGSIVVQKAANQTDPDIVLDGQQRLCTASLIVASISHLLNEAEAKLGEELRQFLLSGRLFEQKHPKIRMQDGDRAAFEELLSTPVKEATRTTQKHPLGRAARTIEAELRRYASDTGQVSAAALQKMVHHVIYDLEVVKISAVSESAAFRLFETLNDRGLPLNAADLIKNKLFSRAHHFLEQVQDLWKEIVDELRDLEVVQFFRHWWVAFFEDVSKARLFDAVSKHLERLTPTEALSFAKEVRAAAAHYRRIAQPTNDDWKDNEPLKKQLESINQFRARSCRPFLLLCAARYPEQLAEAASACLTLTVRHTVIGNRNPNQLEVAYAKCCRQIRDSKPRPSVKEAIREQLRPFSPDDVTFQGDFLAIRTGNITSSDRALLVALNQYISTGETDVGSTARVQVEHVFPRNPSPEALAESGIAAEDAEEWASWLGNLTLLSGRKNQAISNKPYSEKLPTLRGSELAITKALVASHETWTTDAIESRTRHLASLATKIWPYSALSGE